MKTLTPLAMSKLVNALSDEIKMCKYDLDDVEQIAEVTKNVVDDTITIVGIFSDNVIGRISNIRILNSTDEIIAIDNKSYVKPAFKIMYIHFKYKIVEKEVDTNGLL